MTRRRFGRFGNKVIEKPVDGTPEEWDRYLRYLNDKPDRTLEEDIELRFTTHIGERTFTGGEKEKIFTPSLILCIILCAFLIISYIF